MDFVAIVIWLVILLYSAILHEIAHGYVANRLGDPTAKLLGRLTLNPIKHIDPFMSVLLPLILILAHSPVLFGAAKPVPVDEFNLREGRKDMALVALAGPVTNLLLAVIGALLIHVLFPGTSLTQLSFLASFSSPQAIGAFLLSSIVQINLMLGFFNLIPIPPLDGSKFVAMFLPPRDARSYLSLSSVGFMIIFFLLAFPIGGFSLGTLIGKLVITAEQLLGL